MKSKCCLKWEDALTQVLSEGYGDDLFDFVKTEPMFQFSCQINNKEVDPEKLIKGFDGIFEYIEDTIALEYSDIEALVKKRVQEQVEKILHDQVEPLKEKMRSLMNKIDDVNDTIKYEWEV